MATFKLKTKEFRKKRRVPFTNVVDGAYNSSMIYPDPIECSLEFGGPIPLRRADEGPQEPITAYRFYLRTEGNKYQNDFVGDLQIDPKENGLEQVTKELSAMRKGLFHRRIPVYLNRKSIPYHYFDDGKVGVDDRGMSPTDKRRMLDIVQGLSAGLNYMSWQIKQSEIIPSELEHQEKE